MRLVSVAVISAVFVALGVSADQCPKTHFSHVSQPTGQCCLPRGSPPNPPAPPPGKSCPPSTHYWSNQYKCCVPSSPSPPANPQCPPKTSWDQQNQCCDAPTPPSTPSCPSGQFPWDSPATGKCCLPNGGHNSPPPPPPGKGCPPGTHEWNNFFSCCVPNKPNPPSNPPCPSGPWDNQSQCCKPPTGPGKPQPSGGAWHRKNKRSDAAHQIIQKRTWHPKKNLDA